MGLPQQDAAYLQELGAPHTVVADGPVTCVLLSSFEIGRGYDRTCSDLLLRLSPGYPDIPPDMWWFDPPVRLANGSSAPATDCVEQHLGRAWQRWSRHLPPGQWHPGSDSLESFLAVVRQELSRCAGVQSR